MRLRAPSLYTTAVAAILSGIFLRALTGPIDTDLWWHLAGGRTILAHRTIPTADWMTFTFAGRPWVDQWWLAEVVAYLSFRSGGLWAVYLLFAAATALAFVFLYARMRLRGVPQALALTLLVAAALASALSWGPRVQMLSLCLVSMFVWLLDRYAASGSTRFVAPLPFLMVLWVNLHGAFVLGVVILAIDCLASLLDRRPARARTLGLTLLASLGATLVNPALARVWEFPLRTMVPDHFHAVIVEAASPDFHHPAFLPFEILLLTMVASFLASREFQWRDLLLAVAMTHLALSQVRHVSIWAVVVTPLIGAHLASAWRDRGGSEVFTQDLSERARERMNAAVLAFVILSYAVVFGDRLRRVDFQEEERRDFPKLAADRLQSERGPTRLFTTFEWGGYLAWRLHPEGRVYIDGRANSLFDEATLREYLAIIRGEGNWEQHLARRQVDVLVIPTSLPLARRITRASGWQCASDDAGGVAVCRPESAREDSER